MDHAISSKQEQDILKWGEEIKEQVAVKIRVGY